MKRIIPALLLLAGIVGLCIWGTGRVCRISKEASALLEQAETRCFLGDYEGAEQLTLEAQALWSAHEGFLGTTLRHTESDDVGILFPPLLLTLRQKDGREFQLRSLELRAMLRELSRMEVPYYFNVL